MLQDTKKDTFTGLVLAFPIKGVQAKDKSKELIREHNIMQTFINNIGQLKYYRKKQALVSSTSTTLNNLFTDLNYLLGLSLLETMEQSKNSHKSLIFFINSKSSQKRIK